MQSRLREIEARRDHQKRQLGTKLLSQLSDQEQAEIDQLQSEAKELRLRLDRVTKERISLEAEKNKLENQLHTNLLRKRESLTAVC